MQQRFDNGNPLSVTVTSYIETNKAVRGYTVNLGNNSRVMDLDTAYMKRNHEVIKHGFKTL